MGTQNKVNVHMGLIWCFACWMSKDAWILWKRPLAGLVMDYLLVGLLGSCLAIGLHSDHLHKRNNLQEVLAFRSFTRIHNIPLGTVVIFLFSLGFILVISESLVIFPSHILHFVSFLKWLKRLWPIVLFALVGIIAD